MSRGSFTVSNSFILFFLWALERTVGNVQNYFWTSIEHMGFEREYTGKYACMGNTGTDLCAPSDSERTNLCIVFSLFLSF